MAREGGPPSTPRRLLGRPNAHRVAQMRNGDPAAPGDDNAERCGLPRAADRDAVDAQGGLTDADRHALAVLAASADAGIEREVVADHAHARERIGTVADQHRAFERCADLAVLNPIGFGALEHELAGRDVDLTAPEAHRIDAVLHRGEDFRRVTVAREHISVGHARHRHVSVTLAPAVAGRSHVHQPRILPVLHVADQDTVLDQDRAVGRRALVIDGKRATPPRHGPVIDDGDALGGDALAPQPRARRSAAAVEIALESVADRFVQHHARPARPEHHVHLAGGRRHGFEIGERLPDRLVDRPLPGARLQETLIALAPAVAVAAGFLAIARAGDHRDIDPHERPYVAVGAAVGAHDLDHLPGRAEADRYLLDPRILLARASVDGFEQLDLGLEARRAERGLVAIEPDVGSRRGP